MSWCRKQDFETADPVITNDVLYQLSYCGGPNAGARAIRPSRETRAT